MFGNGGNGALNVPSDMVRYQELDICIRMQNNVYRCTALLLKKGVYPSRHTTKPHP